MTQPHPHRCLMITSCHDCPNRIEMVVLFKPLGMIPMPNGKEAYDYRNRWVCSETDMEITDDLPDWCPLPEASNSTDTHTPAAPAERLFDVERFNKAMVSGHTVSKPVYVGRTFSAQELKEHDVAIRKAEREQVLNALEEFLNSDDHLSLFKWEVREQIRSLRGGATDEGGERR